MAPLAPLWPLWVRGRSPSRTGDHPQLRPHCHHQHRPPGAGYLVKKPYKKGIKISDAQMRELAIKTSENLPKWNYSILPS